MAWPVRRLAIASSGGDGQAGDGCPGPGPGDQVVDTFGGEVGGQGEERDPDEPDGRSLPILAFAAQLPDHDDGGEELDHRVQAEAGQGDRGGEHPGGDGDGGLGHHPGHAGIFEREAAPA
jgi:hypothetical protein